MEYFLSQYKRMLNEPGYALSLLSSLVALVCSFIINTYAIAFATAHVSRSVSDIILSNTPVLRVDDPLIYGTIAFALITVVLLLWRPERIPFALYCIALFWIIRSFFTVLTHVAPFESYYYSDWNPVITHAFYGGDLFFSGHTGMPFLGTLVFWQVDRRISLMYLVATIFFAVVVLLGHLHYSIDVASAFFITYGIYHIARSLFPEARAWFEGRL